MKLPAIDWQQVEEFNPKTDLKIFLGVCVASAIYRIFMCYGVLKWVAKLIKPEKETKFIHRTFDLIHYFLSAVLGTLAVSGREYAHCFYYAVDCSAHVHQQPQCLLTNLEKLYYMWFAAYYFVDVCFIWTATGPGAIAVHHAATVTMIALSVFCNAHIIGICVMVLHDWVDVPLYIGKVATYLGYNKVKDVSLIIMAVLYAYLRMFNYPVMIWHTYQSAAKDPLGIHDNFLKAEVVLLCVLMCCHIWWFAKIIKGAIKMFTEGKIYDNRSGSGEGVKVSNSARATPEKESSSHRKDD